MPALSACVPYLSFQLTNCSRTHQVARKALQAALAMLRGGFGGFWVFLRLQPLLCLACAASMTMRYHPSCCTLMQGLGGLLLR